MSSWVSWTYGPMYRARQQAKMAVMMAVVSSVVRENSTLSNSRCVFLVNFLEAMATISNVWTRGVSPPLMEYHPDLPNFKSRRESETTFGSIVGSSNVFA